MIRDLTKILFILLSLSGNIYSADEAISEIERLDLENYKGTFCNDTTIEEPPFYISDEYRQGDKIWENLRSIEDHTKVNEYIPRGSIVHAPLELSEVSYAPNHRVPIKVISVPDEKWENDIKGTNRSGQRRRFRHTALVPQGRERAQEGSTGFLDRRALRPAGKFTFFVKETMPIEKTPKGNDYNTLPMSLKMEGDQYVGQNCCEYKTAVDDEPSCFFKYTFQALGRNQEVIEEININPLACSLMEHMLPIPKRGGIDGALGNILNKLEDKYPGFGVGDGVETDELNLSGIKYLPEYKGSSISSIYREYMIKIPLDPETNEGPFNSYHYKPDDDNSSDTYLQATSLCAFTEVLKKFEEECGGGPGCQVQFGDLYHHKNWKAHSSHGSGKCVDIRPMRKSSDADSGLTYNSASYDRERTKKLVEVMKKAGGSPIYFNDSKVPDVTSMTGHHNHLHVCFKPDRQKVKDACSNGI